MKTEPVGRSRWVIAKGYAGPYRVHVPPRRSLHVRFNDLDDPEPIPVETVYSAVVVSDAPIVVQHTRLDSRDARVALMSGVAYPG